MHRRSISQPFKVFECSNNIPFILLATSFLITCIIPPIYAGYCLDVQEHNQCPFFDDGTCHNLRRDHYNCQEKERYHCAWSYSVNRFIEACVTPTICGLGQEPILFPRLHDGKWNLFVRCEKCRESNRFNPKNDTWSNDISECPKTKSRCYQSENKVTCDYDNEFDRYSQNIKCRCDLRNGYRIAYEYNANESACTLDIGFDCMKAKCYPENDLSLIGYRCLPKCPVGFSRTDERSDECIPDISTTPASTGVVSPGTPSKPVTEQLTSRPTAATPKPTTPSTTVTTSSTSKTTSQTVLQNDENENENKEPWFYVLITVSPAVFLVGSIWLTWKCWPELRCIIRNSSLFQRMFHRGENRNRRNENDADTDERSTFLKNFTGDEIDDTHASRLEDLDDEQKRDLRSKVNKHMIVAFTTNANPYGIIPLLKQHGLFSEETTMNLEDELYTTQKNKKIWEAVSRGSWETYCNFKVILRKTKENGLVVEQIKAEESNYLDELQEVVCDPVEPLDPAQPPPELPKTDIVVEACIEPDQQAEQEQS